MLSDDDAVEAVNGVVDLVADGDLRPHLNVLPASTASGTVVLERSRSAQRGGPVVGRP